MFGLLNLNKPPRWTSRDVVNRVQRLVRPAKVGHAGTLDPLATGVLVVCVGPATRLTEYVQRMPKRYVGTFQLGCTSPSDDTELEVTQLADPPVPSRAAVEAALPQFIGPIQQLPPAYSAAKVEGRRAYDLARSGQPVELAPRQVEIHALQIVDYQYPTLVLEVTCGSGTYIRSLGRDLARSLGTGAVMSALQRTAIGPFTVSDACDPEQLLADGVQPHLQPAVRAVADLPRLQLTAAEVEAIRHGRTIARESEGAKETAAVDEAGQLIALLVHRGPNELGPKMVFQSRGQ